MKLKLILLGMLVPADWTVDFFPSITGALPWNKILSDPGDHVCGIFSLFLFLCILFFQ